MTAKSREYKTFPQSVEAKKPIRHGRDIEEAREAIRRPITATPRDVRDWR